MGLLWFTMKIHVDPILPKNFDGTRNELRPLSHQKWWYRPYVVTNGDKFDVYCLDGGAWDRPTWVGDYTDKLAAIGCARAYARTLESMGLT